jgi:2-polyprenyl-3-methyl-5-hydroxy-6-metoxy-1,4-benzoquinol methylase
LARLLVKTMRAADSTAMPSSLSGDVSFRSPRGRISYRDSADHFHNGLLRLLNLDVATFERWLAWADEEETPDPLAALGRAFQRLRSLPGASAAAPAGTAVDAGPAGEPGVVWQPRIAESPTFGVARALDGALGWLVRAEGDRWVREVEPPEYEEAYFEGDPTQAGGYGDYAAQEGWRLEKAQRQVRELQQLGACGPGTRALDVGSGYGFFRRALELAGVGHDGLEISAHARAVAKRLYGFDTAGDDLATRRSAWLGRFDLVTLWDMIEHVAAPAALLADVAACLKPGGMVAIKTPNLDCPEAELFGPHYHSLKREHLVYFAAAGLTAAAGQAGLEPVRVSSTSHLLVGFVGPAQTAAWGEARRGADLVALFRRPAV